MQAPHRPSRRRGQGAREAAGDCLEARRAFETGRVERAGVVGRKKRGGRPPTLLTTARHDIHTRRVSEPGLSIIRGPCIAIDLPEQKSRPPKQIRLTRVRKCRSAYIRSRAGPMRPAPPEGEAKILETSRVLYRRCRKADGVAGRRRAKSRSRFAVDLSPRNLTGRTATCALAPVEIGIGGGRAGHAKDSSPRELLSEEPSAGSAA